MMRLCCSCIISCLLWCVEADCVVLCGVEIVCYVVCAVACCVLLCCGLCCGVSRFCCGVIVVLRLVVWLFFPWDVIECCCGNCRVVLL